MPHPYEELSVTRLIQITDDEVWRVGQAVAAARTPPRTLYGRGDVLAATYRSQPNLDVVADPVEGNPNHANVTGWPPADDETAQIMIAKEIAAVAKFVPLPESGAMSGVEICNVTKRMDPTRQCPIGQTGATSCDESEVVFT